MSEAVAAHRRHFGIDPTVPFAKLPKKHRDLLLYGPAAVTKPADEGEKTKKGKKKAVTPEPFGRDFEGVIPNLRRRFDEGSWAVQEELDAYRALRACPTCGGSRLRPESLAVTLKGRTIADYVNLPITEALDGVRRRSSSRDREAIIADAHPARRSRTACGSSTTWASGYLTLGRSAATLSGGEGQRIRLATQIGSNLTGVLYVLDEPSIGLHQRDNRKLLATLERLRDLGNTVVVVEHDEETIRTADYVIDLGPGAGDTAGR